MAGDPARADVPQFRGRGTADVHNLGAAGMKSAACRGIDGGGEFAAQHDPFLFAERIGYRGG